jgi:solute carrier family 25 carnitine/acylcarnitine transporter 20/29
MSSAEALHSPVDAKVPGDMGSRSQSTPGVVPGATVSIEKKSDYKGFVAGVFSGIAKLTGMFFFLFPLVYEGFLLVMLQN